MSFGLGYTIADCAVAVRSLPRRVRAILNKYNATMLLPGVSGVLRLGYQPGNYRESTGQTLAAADQQVGLVVDAARSPGPELVTNGGFDTDLSGWYVGANVSAVQNSGEAVVTFAGAMTSTAGNWFSAGPSVQTGDTRRFAVEFDATWVSGSGSLQVGTAFTVSRTIAPNAGKTRYSVISTLGSTGSINPGAAVFGATASGTTWRIDNVSVRELPGIHATQSTSGFQPVLRQEPILGPELVTNGVFDSDVSGWSPDAAGASVTWSSGRMVVGSDGAGFKAGRQVITTVVGRTYQISGTKTGGTATAGKLRVFSGAAEIVRFSYTSATSVTLGGVFVATTTSTTIQAFTDTANATSEWDNISVREITGYDSRIQSWQFDGTDDRLSLSAVPFQMADDHFVIGGATVANLSALRALFGAYSSTQNNPRMQMYCAPTTGACIVQLSGDSGASVVPSAGTATANQPFVFGWEKQGSVVRALFDNAVSTNVSTASIGTLTVDMAAIGETKGAFHNGMIHGLIIGKGAISASERQTLVKFMAGLQGRSI